MPRYSKAKNNQKVFLDSSAVIAAALSEKGGSFFLFQQAKQDRISLFISEAVSQEATMAVQRKYPDKLPILSKLLSNFPVNLIKDASEKSVKLTSHLIHPKDAPVLAAALKHKMEFLVTFDQEHFFTPEIKQAKLPLKILTPGDFIQKCLKP